MKVFFNGTFVKDEPRLDGKSPETVKEIISYIEPAIATADKNTFDESANSMYFTKSSKDLG